MLIDAVHPEETRVALVADGRVDDFDFEAAGKRQLRGNIYLAKVTRVEPSLQAAFVEYGGNRHGFLAFSEIHPDYYQLPQEDREALLREEAELAAAEAEEDDDDAIASGDAPVDAAVTEEIGEDEDEDDDDEDTAEAQDDESAEPRKRRKRIHPSRRYKIQEVIRRRQVMLIQVVKEERGNKGAALTTYLSLAGRYCVLMPNTPRGGGISRKISTASDRKRLKTITRNLDVPAGMGLIVRTAGAKRLKSDIKRDFDYLQKLWDSIRENTFNSMAPSLINEEGGLVHRAMRDLYDKDVEEVLIQGPAAYREAKDLARLLMPSHARRVKQWKDPSPLFVAKRVEEQLDSIFSPVVKLKSGGYLVINQTEALVAIDVNSGKSTRGRNIEQTATQTNLEAAEEACRQMRLRDLAGLVVIDFIDMDENKNNRAVEKRMKDCLSLDRARVQNGRISQFGLMEISRQRRRTGVLESSSVPCDSCNGTGRQRSIESAALQLLRAIEARVTGGGLLSLAVDAPGDVALYLLNNKRDAIAEIEEEAGLVISISSVEAMLPGDFTLHGERDPKGKRGRKQKPLVEGDPDDEAFAAAIAEQDGDEDEEPAPKRTRSKRGRNKDTDQTDTSDAGVDEDTVSADDTQDEDSGERKRRRRGRRGGRRRRREESETARAAAQATEAALALPAIESTPPLGKDLPPEDGGAYLDGLSMMVSEVLGEGLDEIASERPAKAERGETEDGKPERKRRRRSRGRGRNKSDEDNTEPSESAAEATEVNSSAEPDTEEAAAPKRRRRRARKPKDEATQEDAVKSENPEPQQSTEAKPEQHDPAEAVAASASDPEPKPKKRGWWARRKTG
jgi:ribonuclease E